MLEQLVLHRNRSHYPFIAWPIPVPGRFPRTQNFPLGNQIQNPAFERQRQLRT